MKFLSVRTLHFVATFLRIRSYYYLIDVKLDLRGTASCVVVWLVRRRVVCVCVCVHRRAQIYVRYTK